MVRKAITWKHFCLNAVVDTVADAMAARLAPVLVSNQWNVCHKRAVSIVKRLSIHPRN